MSLNGTATSGRSAKAPQPPAATHSALATRAASFAAVLQLINDPSTCRQFERHASQITATLAAFKGGLSAAVALDGAPQVLQFLVSTVKTSEPETLVLVEPMSALLEVCGKRIVCTTLNDQRIHKEALRTVAEAVSQVLSMDEASLRVTAAVVLRQIFEFIRETCFDDLNINPNVTFHKKKDLTEAITAHVVESLLRAWADNVEADAASVVDQVNLRKVKSHSGDSSDDDGVPPPAATSTRGAEMGMLCKAVLELTNYRALCEEILKNDGAGLIFATLRLCTAGDRRVSFCVEMLWNILQLLPSSSQIFGSPNHLTMLHNVLYETLSLGYKLRDRELRNDIVVVLSLIAQDPATHENFNVELIELLIALSCGAECGAIADDLAKTGTDPDLLHRLKNCAKHPAVNKTYHHTASVEDLALKRLGWDLLASLCRDAELSEFIFSRALFRILLFFVDVQCTVPSVVSWSTLQLLDIQGHVLRILTFLVGTGYTHFSECRGAEILRSYISECPKVSLRNDAVAVLARVATTPVRRELIDVGIVTLAIELLDQHADENLLIDCLNLLADVVAREPALQREFLDNGGIPATLPLLVLQPLEFTDNLESVIFGAVDCAWSCIFGAPANERAFINHGGVHAMLSVLETVPRWMVPMPLSCLADLLQNPLAAEQCRKWRSTRTGRSGAQVLLGLWNMVPLDEPANAHDDRGAELVAANSSVGLAALAPADHRKPLGTSRARIEAAAAAAAAAPGLEDTSPEEQRMIASTGRAPLCSVPDDISHIVDAHFLNFKVYAALSVLGFDGHNELDAEERATLAAAEQLVALCKDEVWEAVAASLAEDGVVPISSDLETLREMRREADERSSRLLATRRALSEIHTKRKEESESTFYRSLIKKTEEKHVASHKAMGLSITEAKIYKQRMLRESYKQATSGKPRNLGTAVADDTTLDGPADPAPTSIGVVAALPDPTAAGLSAADERYGKGHRAMTDEEYAILKALNQVRTDPLSFVPHLQQKLKFLDDGGHSFYMPNREPEPCEEGALVYEEAIEVLRNVRPAATLLDVPLGMLYAARDHVADLRSRESMTVTQEGSDGASPQTRLQRYGTVGKFAQLMSLEQTAPIDIVMQLMVGDGDKSRIDRKTILDPDMQFCGVAIDNHTIHGKVCIIVLAHTFQDRPEKDMMTTHKQIQAAWAAPH